jgi:hypothetical protein
VKSAEKTVAIDDVPFEARATARLAIAEKRGTFPQPLPVSGPLSATRLCSWIENRQRRFNAYSDEARSDFGRQANNSI